jgi:hypothetical protein
LKARFDKARAEDRPQLGIKSPSISSVMRTNSTTKARSIKPRVAVEDVVTYSEKARDAATQTKKQMKEVEIGARKMAEKLRDIKRNLAFEDQSPVKDAIDRLEAIRTTLLDEMFAKDDKKGKK